MGRPGPQVEGPAGDEVSPGVLGPSTFAALVAEALRRVPAEIEVEVDGSASVTP